MSTETRDPSHAEQELTKRETIDLLIKDLERQAELKILEAHREIEAVEASITTMYKVSGAFLGLELNNKRDAKLQL